MLREQRDQLVPKVMLVVLVEQELKVQLVPLEHKEIQVLREQQVQQEHRVLQVLQVTKVLQEQQVLRAMMVELDLLALKVLMVALAELDLLVLKDLQVQQEHKAQRDQLVLRETMVLKVQLEHQVQPLVDQQTKLSIRMDLM